MYYSSITVEFDNPIWYRKFAFLPHRSKISNKLIWLKFAYSQITMHGYYTEWRTEQEHMMEIIKG